jgi:hypothetical protein
MRRLPVRTSRSRASGGGLRVQLETLSDELIVLADNLRERVAAVEEAAFLLTVAWPAGAGAWQQELIGKHLEESSTPDRQ